MAVSTSIVRHLQTMAFHAGLHIELLFAAHHDAFLYGAMTGLAGDSINCDVLGMIEKHEVWDAIDARPGDFCAAGMKLRQLGNMRTVLLHGSVAAHASFRLGISRKVTGIGHCVAKSAFQTLGNMSFVTEWNRLFRRIAGNLRIGNLREHQRCQREKL